MHKQYIFTKLFTPAFTTICKTVPLNLRATDYTLWDIAFIPKVGSVIFSMLTEQDMVTILEQMT